MHVGSRTALICRWRKDSQSERLSIDTNSSGRYDVTITYNENFRGNDHPKTVMHRFFGNGTSERF
jgi:hypothetical protein